MFCAILATPAERAWEVGTRRQDEGGAAFPDLLLPSVEGFRNHCRGKRCPRVSLCPSAEAPSAPRGALCVRTARRPDVDSWSVTNAADVWAPVIIRSPSGVTWQAVEEEP